MTKKYLRFLEAIGLFLLFVFIIPLVFAQSISTYLAKGKLTSDTSLLLYQICIDLSFLLAIATALYLWKQKVIISSYVINNRNLLLTLIIAICSYILYDLFDPIQFYSIVSTQNLNFFTFEFPKLETLSSTYIFIKSILFAPIYEEIFYRRLIFKKISKDFPIWVALVFSSILFSLGHMDFNNFLFFFMMGMLYGYVYYKTKSLLLAMLLHASFNLLVALFITEPIGFQDQFFPIVVVIYGIAIIALYSALRHLRKINEKID